MCSAQTSFAATTVARSTPKGFSIDPAAVALFDRAAKLYSECKTIRVGWLTRNESVVPSKTQKLMQTTFVFERPAKTKLEIKYGFMPRTIYVVDGKFTWGLQTVSSAELTYSQWPVEKNLTPIENALFVFIFASDDPSSTFSTLLEGRHELQPAIVENLKSKDFITEYFEAKKLAPAIWKNRSWERVQIHQRFSVIIDGKSDQPTTYNHIYWLAPDNARLVRIQELDANGKIGLVQEFVEQTLDSLIPASTFVFKIPPGAKKSR